MLNAVAIANRNSGAGGKLRDLELPFRHVFEPENINWSECLAADLLVMFGGDGTIQHTTTDMLTHAEFAAQKAQGKLPALAIVPYGTTNMSARTINRSMRRYQAVRSLKSLLNLETYDQLTTHSHPLLKIQAGEDLLYGYALGAGVIANFVTQWHEGRADVAALHQLRSLLTLLRGLQDTNDCTRVLMNNQPMELYMMVLTTLRELIYGSRPFWGSARDANAAIRATWIDSGTPGLLGVALSLLRGAPRMAGMNGFGSRGFPQLELICEGPMVLDGEVYDYRDRVLKISADDSLVWVAL
jgi:hypothetical protein